MKHSTAQVVDADPLPLYERVWLRQSIYFAERMKDGSSLVLEDQGRTYLIHKERSPSSSISAASVKVAAVQPLAAGEKAVR